MGKQSKQELEKAFWEKWKMKLAQLFMSSQKRKEQETKEKQSYIDFIHEYTELYGVRETCRKLELSGFKIDASEMSKVRNSNVSYTIDYLMSLCDAMSKLGISGIEKKPE